MKFNVEVKPEAEKELNILRQLIEENTIKHNQLMGELIKDINHINARWREVCKDHILAGGQNFTKDQIVNFMSGEGIYVTVDKGMGIWEINIPKPEEQKE